jgi:nicotinamide-nucleotide amidase
VGTVHLAAVGPEGTVGKSLVIPGSRGAVRQRTGTVAMQLLRVLLLGGPPV